MLRLFQKAVINTNSENAIGERIKKIRVYLNMTMTDFGSRLGVKRNTVSQWESGTNSVKEQILKSICREFNVNYFWLSEGIGDDPFVGLPETALDEIVEEYKLDDLDKQLIVEYLNLKPDARSAIKEYIKNVFKKM